MTNQTSHIAKNIVWLRDRDGLTQAAVAKRCQVSRVAVAKWESGDSKNLKLTHLFALVDLFKITERQLVHIDLSAHPAALAVQSVAQEPGSDRYHQFQLSEEDSVILAAYRHFPPELQRSWLVTARDYLATQTTNQKQAS